CCALVAGLGGAFARRFHGPRAFAAAAVLAFGAVFVLTLYTDHFCLYKAIYPLPGVNAFRAVARVALVLAFPAAAPLAYLLTARQAWLRGRAGPGPAGAAAGLLLTAVIVEQTVLPGGLVRSPKRQWQERAGRLVELVRRQDPRARLLLNLTSPPEDVQQPYA